MIRLLGTNLLHVLSICQDIPADEWDQIAKMGGPLRHDALAIWAYNVAGPKWTNTDAAGKTLMVGGLIPQREGVYQSWFLATNHAWKNHAKELTVEAIELKEIIFRDGAHRVETVCLASRSAALVWYQKVGLTFESTMKSYCTDGSDAVMYVDTRPQWRKH
jgi:hypothetical protein